MYLGKFCFCCIFAYPESLRLTYFHILAEVQDLDIGTLVEELFRLFHLFRRFFGILPDQKILQDSFNTTFEPTSTEKEPYRLRIYEELVALCALAASVYRMREMFEESKESLNDAEKHLETLLRLDEKYYIGSIFPYRDPTDQNGLPQLSLKNNHVRWMLARPTIRKLIADVLLQVRLIDPIELG